MLFRRYTLYLFFLLASSYSTGGVVMLHGFWWVIPFVFLVMMVVCMLGCSRMCGSHGGCCGMRNRD